MIRQTSFDITIPLSTEIHFLHFIQCPQFKDFYTDYFQTIKILTTNKSNCSRFISIGLDSTLMSLLTQQKFDECNENLLTFCCLHIIDFKLQFQHDQFLCQLDQFINSCISIQNKLNLFMIYAKNCYDSQESYIMSDYLELFTQYLENDKVCRKFAWIMYYISKNNIENISFFIQFFPLIRFNEYKKEQNILKPYLQLLLTILKNTTISHQYEIIEPIVNDIYYSQNDLFDIAFSIANSPISINIYKLLKITYQIKIQQKDKSLMESVDILVKSQRINNLIYMWGKSDFHTKEPIIAFLSILLPLINEVSIHLLLTNLIPKMIDMINSGSDIRPISNVIFILIDKLRPCKNHLQNLINLLIENHVTEEIRSFIYENDIDFQELLDKCDVLDKECAS